MYPPNAMESNQAFYQDSNNNQGNHHHYKFNKPGYNNRKISQDSGISDFSSVASRKTSNISTVSNVTIDEEPSVEEATAAETPLEIPTDEMCEEIVQQVRRLVCISFSVKKEKKEKKCSKRWQMIFFRGSTKKVLFLIRFYFKQDRFITCFITCSPILRGGEWVQSPWVSRLDRQTETRHTVPAVPRVW